MSTPFRRRTLKPFPRPLASYLGEVVERHPEDAVVCRAVGPLEVLGHLRVRRPERRGIGPVAFPAEGAPPGVTKSEQKKEKQITKKKKKKKKKKTETKN
jgi:hypothetical protein